MKINFHFNQSVFRKAEMPFSWSQYFCPFFDGIVTALKNDPSLSLEFFSNSLNSEKDKKLIIYFNTIDKTFVENIKKTLNELSSRDISYTASLNNFDENEYFIELLHLFDKFAVKKLDLSQLFKASSTSLYEVLIINPVVENCLCPILNTLLAHGTQILNIHDNQSSAASKTFQLSFQHGVRLIKRN